MSEEKKLPAIHENIEALAAAMAEKFVRDDNGLPVEIPAEVYAENAQKFGGEALTLEMLKAAEHYNNSYKASAMLAIGRDLNALAKDNKALENHTVVAEQFDKNNITVSWTRKVTTPGFNGGDPVTSYGVVKGTVNHHGEKNIGNVKAVYLNVKAEAAKLLAD